MRKHAVAFVAAGLLASFAVSATAQTPPPAGTGGWAIVGPEGLLLKRQNVTASHHIGTGTYKIDFNSDVSDCVYTGNARGVVKSLVPGIVVVARHERDLNAVFVRIFDAVTLLPTDEKFNLLVTC